MIMLRIALSSVSGRVAVARRTLAPAIARRTTLAAFGPSCRAGHDATSADRASTVPVAALDVSSSLVRFPQQKQRFCRSMCSASNRSKPTGDQPRGEDGRESGEDTSSTSGGHGRDPQTGEGMWIDDEDEPLVLEKPKKIQKFCGKVVSDKMDKSITVAVPYWYYVKGLGRRIIRHSKIMAHDEEESCRIGDKVIIVDCKRKSKRKAHTLHQIVHKLPRLDDPS